MMCLSWYLSIMLVCSFFWCHNPDQSALLCINWTDNKAAFVSFDDLIVTHICGNVVWLLYFANTCCKKTIVHANMELSQWLKVLLIRLSEQLWAYDLLAVGQSNETVWHYDMQKSILICLWDKIEKKTFTYVMLFVAPSSVL